ncbi:MULTISPECIES: hypothetical protein [Corynebacterium]|uniref:Uncharacterized protein n=1 Tax=Corynebacterium ihumii TaxID=1232427 RepID=A0ABY7UAD1_9CORY|nr:MULTISPECIES: hypothetical protein [Corynebacterium]WCZ33634.1 hypothetical protein CIHUM_00930 [Corynebacterium ihumii]
MNNAEITAMATAVDVLHDDRHRPPLDQVSPAAAALRDEEEGEQFTPTWRDLGLVIVGILVFWVLYVGAWVVFGGAA